MKAQTLLTVAFTHTDFQDWHRSDSQTLADKQTPGHAIPRLFTLLLTTLVENGKVRMPWPDLTLHSPSPSPSLSASGYMPPTLVEKCALDVSKGTTDSSLELDGRGRGGPCHDEFVDATLRANEWDCMHVSSLSRTMLMLERSSGLCAQHSAVSVWILSLVEGFENCGRFPRKALEAAATPVIPSKARRS